MLRIDRETVKTIADEIHESITNYVQIAIPRVNVVLISDYGKGLLTKDLLSTITDRARQAGKPTIVDPKGTNFKKYRNATLITPNKKEASLAAGIEIVDEATLDQAADILFEKTGTQNLLITCGKDGMALYEGRSAPYTIHSRARQVFDVSGAGDTVLAVTGLSLAAGRP